MKTLLLIIVTISAAFYFGYVNVNLKPVKQGYTDLKTEITKALDTVEKKWDSVELREVKK